MRCRNTMASNANASNGIVRKRMKTNGATPIASSTYLVKGKFMPHTNIVARAAVSDQRSAAAGFSVVFVTLGAPQVHIPPQTFADVRNLRLRDCSCNDPLRRRTKA